MQLEFSRLIFGKSLNIKFHENPSSGSRVVTCGQKNGQADMTNLQSLFAILRTRLEPDPSPFSCFIPQFIRTTSTSSSYLSLGELPLSKTGRESARNRRSLNADATFVTDLWFLQAAELCNFCETRRIRNHVVKLLNRKKDDVDCRDCRGCYCDSERARVTALIAIQQISIQERGLCTDVLRAMLP